MLPLEIEIPISSMMFGSSSITPSSNPSLTASRATPTCPSSTGDASSNCSSPDLDTTVPYSADESSDSDTWDYTFQTDARGFVLPNTIKPNFDDFSDSSDDYPVYEFPHEQCERTKRRLRDGKRPIFGPQTHQQSRTYGTMPAPSRRDTVKPEPSGVLALEEVVGLKLPRPDQAEYFDAIATSHSVQQYIESGEPIPDSFLPGHHHLDPAYVKRSRRHHVTHFYANLLKLHCMHRGQKGRRSRRIKTQKIVIPDSKLRRSKRLKANEERPYVLKW